jgi:hypothetical protein
MWLWRNGATATFTEGGKEVTKTSKFTHLLIAEATGTTSTGATKFTLTLMNQNKVAATGSGFSGGGGNERLPSGNYTIHGEIRNPAPTAIASDSPEHNPPPADGIQKMLDRGLTDPKTGVTYNTNEAYGPMRAYLNPWNPAVPNSLGNYFHGQLAGYHLLGITHGCLCYGSDTRIINYLYELGEKVPVAVDTPVERP